MNEKDRGDSSNLQKVFPKKASGFENVKALLDNTQSQHPNNKSLFTSPSKSREETNKQSSVTRKKCWMEL